MQLVNTKQKVYTHWYSKPYFCVELLVSDDTHIVHMQLTANGSHSIPAFSVYLLWKIVDDEIVTYEKNDRNSRFYRLKQMRMTYTEAKIIRRTNLFG